MKRLQIKKTPKVFSGGAFIRSESGRVFPVRDEQGALLGHVPQCTRKDLRNAVESAAKAGASWARRTPYNRAQILYRLAEMLESRSEELARTLGGGEGATDEVAAAIDRVVYYAGWADKFEQVLGSVNPVASPHFNFTVTEPMGVVGIISPDTPALLGLLSWIAPVIVSGNAVVALASETAPYPAIVLGEMLATSDLPAGVVNLLTGFRKELIPTFATHEHLRALGGTVSSEGKAALEKGAAASVKRCHLQRAEEPFDWRSEAAQSVYWIQHYVEAKTVWHPIGS
ncbi:MAG TPA: aldehyde dehydrogenase family protein [Opitutaceae bacterium]|nr:aldehyde dehydrogenase family protein [Opitutaceae bacterium]